jgi:hypothetical protein
MAMKVYGKHNKKEIDCCVVLDYRGYSLSLSTIAKPHEFLIFKNEKSTVDLTKKITDFHSLLCTAAEIREACDRIDDYLKDAKEKNDGENMESDFRKSGGQ